MRNVGSCAPGGTAPGDTISTLGSSDVVDLGVVELGLLGHPGAPSPPASWRWVEDSAKLACSPVAAACQLMREAMVVAGRDVLHPVRVSLEERSW
jgi:hypothetical protein